jgi:hypothetical protein
MGQKFEFLTKKYRNPIKNFLSEIKRIFGQKFKFLAHSGGWIVSKIIF